MPIVTNPIEARQPGEDAAHRDPITKAPGAHPTGTAVGATAAGAAGALTGAFVGGPVGAVVGAAIGAVAGGIGGHEMAEGLDPTVEDTYWRQAYTSRPYVAAGRTYDDYGPAYRYALAEFGRRGGRFEEAESELAAGWPTARDRSRLDWAEARDPARDAWSRLYPDD